ncbi:MAG: Flagellar biosynthetic protein flhB [Pseudomonadota bacterium]
MADMSRESELDRTLPATPWKLEKSREKGVVGKSPEVVSALVLLVAVAWAAMSGWDALRAQFAFDRALFLRAAKMQWTIESSTEVLAQMIAQAGGVLLPLFVCLMVVAVLANVAQTGVIFSAKPLVPDWSRLNPVAGLKRMFSMRLVFDAFRAVLKLCLLTGVMVWVLASLAPSLPRFAMMPPASFLHELIEAFTDAAFLMAGGLIVLSVVDFLYTRREFLKKMRMSHRELKDEIKHREGDSRIRARLKELRRELLARSQTLSRTRGADVLITNPTHLAVALSYKHGEMDAPKVIAKGAGKLAAAMREVASRRGIPIVQNRTLARAIWRKSPVDGFVPAALYGELAKIMVWVIALNTSTHTQAGAR